MSGDELPVPRLRALTPEAAAAAGGRAEIVLDRLPFRIGRESRDGFAGRAVAPDRRGRAAPPSNEFYLRDAGRSLFISREHVLIDRAAQGGYLIRDRGSACGTLVGSRILGGGRHAGACPLADGNVVVLGTAESPYAWQFLVGEDS
jgi:hypothetical protein